ncbi:hypothetical protein LWI28_013501 [Acer negundo]|uniref:Uncharacterized protein n=1 Tax=Acer negundo TaxID=4023 RepID=A0AAD5IEY2_ACENE|nr:hypothetical protein LWI28_013501 [Acer negundo]
MRCQTFKSDKIAKKTINGMRRLKGGKVNEKRDTLAVNRDILGYGARLVSIERGKKKWVGRPRKKSLTFVIRNDKLDLEKRNSFVNGLARISKDSSSSSKVDNRNRLFLNSKKVKGECSISRLKSFTLDRADVDQSSGLELVKRGLPVVEVSPLIKNHNHKATDQVSPYGSSFKSQAVGGIVNIDEERSSSDSLVTKYEMVKVTVTAEKTFVSISEDLVVGITSGGEGCEEESRLMERLASKDEVVERVLPDNEAMNIGSISKKKGRFGSGSTSKHIMKTRNSKVWDSGDFQRLSGIQEEEVAKTLAIGRALVFDSDEEDPDLLEAIARREEEDESRYNLIKDH